ncbi:MAG: hypothetical protein AAGN46_05545 [Acidobacteriota bacterium]
MRHRLILTLLLPLLPLLLVSLTGCDWLDDDDDAVDRSPTAPPTALTAEYSYTLTPTAVADDGVCRLALRAQPFGGTGRGTYEVTWIVDAIDQALTQDGYPRELDVELTFPNGVALGLPVELQVTDAAGEFDTTSSDTLSVDCDGAAIVRRTVL